MHPAPSMGNMHLETLTEETMRQVVEKEQKRVEAEQAARRAVSPPLISVTLPVTAQPR